MIRRLLLRERSYQKDHFPLPIWDFLLLNGLYTEPKGKGGKDLLSHVSKRTPTCTIVVDIASIEQEFFHNWWDRYGK
jgi:hypothetical protein